MAHIQQNVMDDVLDIALQRFSLSEYICILLPVYAIEVFTHWAIGKVTLKCKFLSPADVSCTHLMQGV